ncbi:sensor histidine kinase [Pelosinus propionicus]|uniref:sensor histidine kinase n=1 Tax=Pelosinus propionicus TaxID=380084 RepID=UPI000A601355|nr:sensor histidine kinase [Pelosinus propionicus]
MKYAVSFTLLTVLIITFLLGGTFILLIRQEIAGEMIPWSRYKDGSIALSAANDNEKLYHKDRKKILVLHSYHSEMPWVKLEEQGIKSVLQQEKQAVLYFDYMDTKQNITSDYLESLYKLYEQKYKGRKFDAVIVTDDAAYNFALTHQQTLFSSTPIIFCGVNYFNEAAIQDKTWITGIIEDVDIKSTIEAALVLQPQVTKMVVINDETTVGKANKQLLEKIIPSFDSKIQFIFLEKMAMSEVLEKIAALSDDTAVLLMTFNVDKDETIFSYEEAGELIGSNSKVPVYCFWDFYLKSGMLGGKVTSGFNQGKVAGELARKIVFEGILPVDIPVVKESIQQYMFDYHALRKAGIKEDSLPAGSIVVNNPVTFYETYKYLVWFLTVSFMILLLLVSILAVNINRRRKVEEEIRHLNRELENQVSERTKALQDTNSALRHTLEDLQQTRSYLVEVEKMASLGELVAGVAHEINTPVGNSITAISHLSEKTGELDRKLSGGQMKKSDLQMYLESSNRVSKIIFTNLERAAELIRSFKKVAVDQLVEERRSFQLEEYIQDVLLSLKPQLKKTHHRVKVICPAKIKVYWYPGAFWQIISNMLNNSIMHAYDPDAAGTIIIEISYADGLITLTYTDDGKGMTPEVQKKIFDPFFTTRRGTGGTGLGMHIVYNLVVFKMEGTIECVSQLGVGTTFIVKLPERIQGKGETNHV